MNKLNNIAGIFVVLPSFSAGVITTYYYDGTRLIAETNGDHVLIYMYDAAGSPIGMQYRDSTYADDAWDIYWYEKNMQGDIVAIYDETGIKLISYQYTAWGHTTQRSHNSGSSTPAAKNPFMYRGYYFDADLNLYYLQSRYYDQINERFLTPDCHINANGDLVGFNMYAYCSNNSLSNKDEKEESLINEPFIIANANNSLSQVEVKTSMFDLVHKIFSFDPSSVNFGEKNFRFDENPQYNFFNARSYAKYIKENYYSNDDTRSVRGLYYELQLHYILYLIGNEHGTDGADMRSADWDEDWNAVIFEFMANFASKLEKSIYSPKLIWG